MNTKTLTETEGTKAKHTPAPWRISNGLGNDEISIRYKDGDFSTEFYTGEKKDSKCVGLLIQSSTVGLERAKANARLIAASPEMFSALEDLLVVIGYLEGDGGGSPIAVAIRTARAAIANATLTQ